MPSSKPDDASAAAEKPVEKARRNIQSIEVGFQLIRTLEEAPGPLSLKILSKRSGMEPSKAHLYLVSFCNLGLVDQDETGYYKLGAYALQLGLSALNKIDLTHLARKVLLELRDETGEAASLSVHGDKGPVIIAKVDGLKDDPLVVRLGRILRLASSAAGRVFMTYSDADSVRKLLADEVESGQTNMELVAKIRDEVRERGYARAESLAHAGFSSLAAPVFDHEGKLAGAVTLIGLSSNFASESVARLTQALLQKTRLLSFQLGSRP